MFQLSTFNSIQFPFQRGVQVLYFHIYFKRSRLSAVSYLIQIYMFIFAHNSVSKRSFYFQFGTGSRMICTGNHIRFHCARRDSRAGKKVTLQKINKRRRRGSSGGGRQAPRILTFSEDKNKNKYIWDNAVCQEEWEWLAGARQRGKTATETVNSCCGVGLICTEAPCLSIWNELLAY